MKGLRLMLCKVRTNVLDWGSYYVSYKTTAPRVGPRAGAGSCVLFKKPTTTLPYYYPSGNANANGATISGEIDCLKKTEDRGKTQLACSSAFRKMKPRRFFAVFADFFTAFSGRFFKFRQSGFLPLFYEAHFCGKLSGFCRISKCGKKPLRFFWRKADEQAKCLRVLKFRPFLPGGGILSMYVGVTIAFSIIL